MLKKGYFYLLFPNMAYRTKFAFQAIFLSFCIALVFLYFFSSCKNTHSKVENAEAISYNFQVRPILSDKCFACHGPDARKREAGLRLDTEAGTFAALKDNPNAFVVLKGKPSLSELYLRVSSTDSNYRMPPPAAHMSLSPAEIVTLKKWIEQGATFQKHWAYIAPQKAPLPQAPQNWSLNEIDNFTYQKMQAKGLEPNAEAEKATLLKRVYFDLTGLPPSIEAQQAFEGDNSPLAYENMVNKLLSSKHYGEKMALNWLDVARYADSHGYQDDGLRTMWPWRDWVIHAFNQNYSYRKFVTWQLAGDIMAKKMPQHAKAKEMTLATGFNRNHKITQEGGVIDEEYRVEYVTDRTNTFGKAFLALTFECAKCHDHKFDAISQKDYYSSFAFFNQVPEKGLFGTIDASFADPPNMRIEDKDVASILNFIQKKDTNKLEVMVMADTLATRPTYILNRGQYDNHGAEVSFGMPASVLPFDGFEKNRYGLSQWLFDKKNPLTARVFVNRIWAQFFGRGIVKTLGDFGMQGELPSHPELLDWLAVDFMQHGWNIKRLVKQIVMSATYRQSAIIQKNHLNIDPDNVYLARAGRYRLPAEIVRDHVLASSSLLNTDIGGPSIKPYQPKGLWEVATSGRGSLSKYVEDEGPALYRRGMYVFVKRTVPPPNMLVFDASNRDQCEVQRSRTNTPLQALVLMNDPHVLEAAALLAEKELKKTTDPAWLIEQAFRKIVCRPPSAKEKELIENYYQAELSTFEKQPKKIEALAKIANINKLTQLRSPQWAALMLSIQMLYNMEETMMRI